MSNRNYVHGTGTPADPIRYDITDEFLYDLVHGHWETGMIQAAVNEIGRLRKKNADLQHIVDQEF